MPTPERGNFALVLKLFDSPFSPETAEAATPPDSSAAHGAPAAITLPPSTLQTLAVAVEAAEMSAAADAAPLLEQSDPGRSKP